MRVLLATCGAWHLPNTASAFAKRQALSGLWITMGNHFEVPGFKRCWLFHAAMLPLYWFAPQIWCERAFYFFFPLWKAWLRAQRLPRCNVVHAIAGYGTELFDRVEQTGAIKVLDYPNSHPRTLHQIWQHELDTWCAGDKVPIPQWMFARMERELVRADIIIVQSRFCKESMVANGIPASKVFINPMGVDTTTFTKRPTVPEKIRFVCVGTICLRKGHQYLFRAWEIVRRKLPNAELVCVGEYKTDFRKERPKWETSFTRIPHMPHAELAEFLKGCTAFVFPSQEEGIARAQVEALACGLPVIGTHEGGATTLIEDGIEGLIVRGRDPEHIAQAMIRCAIDPILNQKMGEAAYKKGGLQNSWQDYGDRLLREYKHHLDARVAAEQRGSH